ncbi:hypothetical protein AK812_SmicGene48751, partial [Symbiodinium microadriaticum]
MENQRHAQAVRTKDEAVVFRSFVASERFPRT